MELQEKIRVALAKIDTTYADPTESKNQRGKFLNTVVENIDPKDTDYSNTMVTDSLEEWDKKILAVKKDEIGISVINDNVVKNTLNKAAEVTTQQKMETTRKLTVGNLSENLASYDQAFQKLSQKLSALSGGKPIHELIPDYTSKLAQTQQNLVKQGQDPKLAE